MDHRKRAAALQAAVTQAMPDAAESECVLWFCRLCALRCMQAHGMQGIPEIALFRGITAIPESLDAAAMLLADIPDSEWQDVSLVGWLFQYRNLPLRETILRSRQKLDAAHVPAATQLFTPDWIVRCMVQNSLAALTQPQPDWAYVLPGDGDARDPASLTLLDPCMGTGHILLYAFDALHALLTCGGMRPDAAALHILEKQLCGTDIDAAAAAVTEFTLMMRAAAWVPDIFTRGVRLHLYDYADLPEEERMFGALLRGSQIPARQYDAVITNPPYLGSSGMPPALAAFVREHYPEGRSDLFAAFMLRCAELTKPDGVFSMIVQHSWMFLSSYTALRRRMRDYPLRSLVHLGAKAFAMADVGTVVQTAVFTAYGSPRPERPACWVRLTDAADKAAAFQEPQRRMLRCISQFAPEPEDPLCFWADERMLSLLRQPRLGDLCRICQGMTTSDNKRFLRRWYEVPPGSIAFGCRDAEEAAASGKTWFPYNKGGKVRRWYGNHLWVVNYRDNGTELRSFHALLNQTHSGGRLKNADTYFRRAVTWQFITEADRFGVRLQPEGFLYDVSGSCLFPEERDFLYVMGLLSSPVASRFLELFNPTMNFQPENLRSIPFVSDRTRMPEIEAHVRSCIALAQEDWDLDAESWDFAVHPLVHHGRGLLADAWEQHAAACRRREGEMQAHESALAGIFAEIYGLEAPAAQAAPTLRPCRRDTAAAGLIEFAAGCMLGRYHMPAFAEETAFLALSEIPAKLERFLAAVMGGETAAENVEWLSDALGMPLDRWCMTKLYPYHLRHFRKRPVFWLATSGRKHAVHGLVNYHRMGESPVPLLMQTAKQAAASPERDKYLERLASLAGERLDPDAGIPANHARFRSIFAAI